jgi:hypothetical protein
MISLVPEATWGRYQYGQAKGSDLIVLGSVTPLKDIDRASVDDACVGTERIKTSPLLENGPKCVRLLVIATNIALEKREVLSQLISELLGKRSLSRNIKGCHFPTFAE